MSTITSSNSWCLHVICDARKCHVVGCYVSTGIKPTFSYNFLLWCCLSRCLVIVLKTCGNLMTALWLMFCWCVSSVTLAVPRRSPLSFYRQTQRELLCLLFTGLGKLVSLAFPIPQSQSFVIHILELLEIPGFHWRFSDLKPYSLEIDTSLWYLNFLYWDPRLCYMQFDFKNL